MHTTLLLSQLKNDILSTLVLCLANHLMCWSDTPDNSFKPVEKLLPGSFQS